MMLRSESPFQGHLESYGGTSFHQIDMAGALFEVRQDGVSYSPARVWDRAKKDEWIGDYLAAVAI